MGANSYYPPIPSREDEIRAEVEQRLAREQRIYARLRAEALAAVDAKMTHYRTYGHFEHVESYGSPWMEPRRRWP